jgi:hypothetical protein
MSKIKFSTPFLSLRSSKYFRQATFAEHRLEAKNSRRIHDCKDQTVPYHTSECNEMV